jgi:glycosyltransferase involved in cell wall biosynthesis
MLEHLITTARMKTISIWLDNPLNDATAHYIELLERSIVVAGASVVRVTSMKNALKADIVLTLHAKATCQILRRNPRAKVITWFQGIVPEEAMLWQGKRMPNSIYKLAWELFEMIALRMSSLCIFVSDAMRVHYYKKYHAIPKSCQVIPCFNSTLKESAFYYESKYTKPTFVYAGGLDRWQCIEEMLSLFVKVQRKIPEASITILSAQQELATKLLAENGIRNGSVSYVPLASLGEELQKYKYGFLLRADHPINNVATPTKMNTYLSVGIIPIYTTAIQDFETKLGHLPYSIKVSNPGGEDNVQRILDAEKRKVSVIDLLESYQNVFASYYSTEYYVEEAAIKIARLK